jgi:ornithine cyclodeaminase/alanine dehydrogenase-like protein (mu-crystallin family)
VHLQGPRAERLATINGRSGVAVHVKSSVEEVVRGSDVVVTATVILAKPNPIIRDEWIAPGALILPVDFDSVWEWKRS